MKSHEEIQSEFRERYGAFINSSRVSLWRRRSSICMKLVHGDQWEAKLVNERKRNQKPSITYNITAPIIRAIVGYGVLNEHEITVQPRDFSGDADKAKSDSIDKMQFALDYVQDDSGFPDISSLATEDVLVTGVGATRTYISMDCEDAPYGQVGIDRLCPLLLLFDSAACKQNMQDGDWIGCAEPVNRKWLDRELEELRMPSSGGGFVADAFLADFGGVGKSDDIDFLYHYEWREREKIYYVENTFDDPAWAATPEAISMLAGALQEHGLTPEAPFFKFEAPDYRKFRAALRNIVDAGALPELPELETSTSKQYRYYRATMARGMVLDASRSFTKGGFSIEVKTGYYDDILGVFYGPVWSMVQPQQAFNETVSDYLSYIRSIPKGGVFIEEGAVGGTASQKAFLETHANEADVTLLKDGGLAKMQPKIAAPVPAGVSEFMNFNQQILFAVIGISPDFLGAVQSKEMTSSLFRRIVRQTTMVLSHLFKSERGYMQRQGGIFIDAVRRLTRNASAIPMRDTKNSGNYETVTGEDFSKEYDVVITPRPLSEDEKQERFEKLMELAGILAGKQNPVDITPLALQYAPLESDDKDRVLQLMQPPPAPQPDPMNEALLESQVRVNIANAENIAADAEAKRVNTAKAALEMQLMPPETAANIMAKEAQAALDRSRAMGIA